MFKQRLICGVSARGLVKSYPYIECQNRNAAWHLSTSARAGIRTRVGGMKTHYDGPGYTTRATVAPPTTP